MNTQKRLSVLGTVLAIVGFGSAPNSAQSQQTAASFTSTSDSLEEVVVTAQKRAERLQDVPISVQVVSSQSLVEQNHNSLESLTETTPGVHVSSGDLANNLYIRGIGSSSNIWYFEQSVATFEDDIYHGHSRMTNESFLDLDRVEILKGPQSTFFGNNAIAGALNIVTAKPGDEYGGWGRALYGMYGQYAAEGALTIPINDKFSIRAAGSFNGQSGWIENVDTGKKAPVQDNKAVRLTALYRPTSDLEATLKIEGSTNKTSGTAGDEPQQMPNCPPPAPFSLAFAAPCVQAMANHAPLGFNNNENAGLPGQFARLRTFEDVLTVNFHHWNHTFTSVSGFSQYHYDADFDGANTGSYYLTYHLPEEYKQFSQEFRVTSAAGGPIEYLAGIYFQTGHWVGGQELNYPGLNGVVFIPGFESLAPYLPLALYPYSTEDEQVYSAFGSMTWNATDRLKLTAGLRASKDHKSSTANYGFGTGTATYGGFVPLPPAQLALAEDLFVTGSNVRPDQHLTDQDLMPSAGVQFQLGPEKMLYFSYRKGFKAGGINSTSLVNIPGYIEFGPEYVNAYELGIKTKWLDNRLLVNLDVFRSDYKDLQVSQLLYIPAINNSLSIVRNAAAARSEGVEMETQWKITRSFRVSANVTYLDSHYVTYPNGGASTLQSYCGAPTTDYHATPECAVYPFPVPPFADISGQRTPYAPLWSGSLEARYNHSLPGGYAFTAAAMPYLTSAYNTQGNGDPFFNVPAYVRLDGVVSVESPEGHFGVDAIGKNLTNRIIVDNPQGFQNGSKQEPVTIAVQLRYRW